MNSNEKLIMTGRLGKNPDLRYTREQKPVCFLSVATNGQEDQKTIWHKVVVWGKQAELCSLYLKKGSELFVRGQKVLREYKNQEGEIKTFLEIQADTLGFTLV